MICPKCHNDSLSTYKTLEHSYLPFKRVVLICKSEKCDFKDYYTMKRDIESEAYTLDNLAIYQKAHVILCKIIKEQANERGNALGEAERLSRKLAEILKPTEL